MAKEPVLSRYLHAKGKPLGIPISGTFELTARCNFLCKMCYVRLTQEEQRKRGRELSSQAWIALAEECKRAGTVFLLLTGGEPTLRPDFPEIYREIMRMGFNVSVNSNGFLLNGALRELFLELPPNRLNISLYGTTDETYERLCGVPAYSTIWANVNALKAAGVDVRLTMSVTPENAQELRDVCEHARKIGAHVQATTYMFPPLRRDAQRVGENARLAPETAGHLAAQLDALTMEPERFRQRGAVLAQGGQPEAADDSCDGAVGSRMLCRAGTTSFWLTWDGRMLPCGQMVTPSFDVTRLGFAASWRSIREAGAEIRLPAACGHCDLARACHVCAAKCYCETGHFDGRPSYLCRMTKQYLQEVLADWQEKFGGAT